MIERIPGMRCQCLHCRPYSQRDGSSLWPSNQSMGNSITASYLYLHNLSRISDTV